MTEEEIKKYDLKLPTEINFELEDLINYAKKDPNFELTFYGGEPLLKIDLIKKIIDNVPAKTYMLQTNGIFLHKLPLKYLLKLNTILISIDGTKKHTNERRGVKVYERVIENLNLIRKKGYKGEIIARMTVDETSNVFENVRYLIENGDFSFNSIHWQLDALFWKSDYETRNFKTWTITNYNPNVKSLIDWWVCEMKNKGVVHKIYPFLGILDSIWSGKPSPLKCGAGHSLLGIQTNGKIVACPITAGYIPFEMGDLKSSDLNDIIKNKMSPQNTCLNCEIRDICGGRCLYANYTKLWGQKGFEEVCDTVFFIVNYLKLKRPIIDNLIKTGKVKKSDFKYVKYNGAEIIP
jgi:putative peptide-modifying radical SAM enzyme